ncbi:MAG: gamma-glutamyl-gamma-aminobutyrate hydrolase family protein [Oscillospiraceae bacterium]|nr:gamma-glutamyl-gamma-aminobutyrate hydrolase family protein [Oscillospiraceae bacterium]
MNLRILISTPREGGPNYVRAVEQAGGAAVPSFCPQADPSGYDGLVLCGGGDLEDQYAGGANPAPAGVDGDRDRAELALIPAFLETGRPILGICRGHQLLNLVLGGTLILDLPPAGLALHTRPAGRDRLHPVRAAADSFAVRLYGGVSQVNSAHHQAVDRLAPGLRAVQWSEDGVLEALEHASAPVWGVQWHPERLDGSGGTAEGGLLFRAFLDLCGKWKHV